MYLLRNLPVFLSQGLLGSLWQPHGEMGLVDDLIKLKTKTSFIERDAFA